MDLRKVPKSVLVVVLVVYWVPEIYRRLYLLQGRSAWCRCSRSQSYQVRGISCQRLAQVALVWALCEREY